MIKSCDFRFFVGGTIHAVWTSMFVITAECNIKEKHGVTGGVLNFGNTIFHNLNSGFKLNKSTSMSHFSGWNIGSMLMTLLAFLRRDWSNLQLAFALISLLLASYYFLVST